MADIKVINAGKCMICGREIKIVTKKHSDELPNIFFCPRCDADNEEWIKRKSQKKRNKYGGYRISN